MLVVMSEDKPNPFDDVRKGLGLLFRAAKTTVEKLPTKDLEEVVVTSAREVGRAIENVGKTIEREVFGKKDESRRGAPKSDNGHTDAGHAAPGADETKPEEPKPPDAS